MTKPVAESVPQPPEQAKGARLRKPVKVYVASRASVPERPAMWQRLRAEGWCIVSTWIDEAGPGQTASFMELWGRIHDEIAEADGVVLYVEPDDFPLKGALVEVGMALGMGKPVVVAMGGGLRLEPGSLRPLGSWAQHPLVDFQPLDGALDSIRIRRAAFTDARAPVPLQQQNAELRDEVNRLKAALFGVRGCLTQPFRDTDGAAKWYVQAILMIQDALFPTASTADQPLPSPPAPSPRESK